MICFQVLVIFHRVQIYVRKEACMHHVAYLAIVENYKKKEKKNFLGRSTYEYCKKSLRT